MKIALAQLNYTIGDIEGNCAKIIKSIHRAKSQQADLVIFAELAICGYPARDLLEFDSFIQDCEDVINSIAKECIGISAIVGGPCRNANPGKQRFNSA